MRLSEAILLGDSLRSRDARRYLSNVDGHLCGCGLGGAWLAVGKTVHDWRAGRGQAQGCYSFVEERLRTEWPWVTADDVTNISRMFSRVCAGEITLEQLADYVRSIEPAEPGETVSGEGPNQVTERAELLKVKEVKAEELETMPR